MHRVNRRLARHIRGPWLARFVVILFLSAFAACASERACPRPDTSSGGVRNDAASAALSRDELANATYELEWAQSGSVKLTNGEYREPAAPGSATETVVKLTDKIAFGRINDRDSVAVVLVTDPGGSGTFYDLAVLRKESMGWENVDATFLGDRVKIHSISIEDGQIVVDMTAHGPDDAMCCPTERVVQSFALQGDHVIKVASGNGGPVGQEIIGIVWKWQQTLYNNDTRAVPPIPESYTLELLLDGQVAIRADCNVGGGVYRLNDSHISIEITHATMAACPPGSLEKTFIQNLDAAALYFLKDGNMYIDLKYDTGTVKFSE